ncbi:ribosomal protein S18-alanine N-acetyltransferase [Variovorax sp. PCZ-1]|uniref:ribosomal protein S18-alanine N-acetyltransferase n=1 Tax=Variovorax sp. PCZ-1 TaxID=2835533 RepID=UPI001BCFECCE|nr:ribosomal protein S18-alanine N-acetyltransferase [Variovorax sp. PCZ-1]MBS7806082.1 ribosomal protein S18-alanine N-acetyltransferase [Variovorax sp. PCZ-1]
MSAQPSILPSAYASLFPQEASFMPMNADDLAEVMHAEREAYLWPWSEGNIKDSINSGNCCQTLRGNQGELLGYYIAMPGVQEVHLLNITVVPAYQRQGWARVMLDNLHDWAREQHAQWVWLEVRISNVRAIGIYEQYGFRRVGVRKAYYPLDGLQREDAIVMSNQP